MTMDDSRLVSIAQIQQFIKVGKDITFQGASRSEQYAWIETILSRFGYFSLRKKEKSVIKEYLMRMTGYSDAQLTRLIAKKKRVGKVLMVTGKRHRFTKKYTSDDIALIIQTDKAHDRLSGPATRKIFEREYDVFGNKEFGRLKDISVSHLYNLRGTRQYRSHGHFFTKTRPTAVPIGARMRPDPQGRPGFLRVDTVHQGDYEGIKGVYHINLVDEVTQWEIVVAVEKISEHHLMPALQDALDQFPFLILGFHSDNGSEYINAVVARLLNKLLIRQTKSRARHCNDNALVEGKNGSIIRKHMGRMHIGQKHAGAINEFYREHFNGYLNFHRPCGFATNKIDGKGRVKKVYRIYRTPFDALLGHPDALKFLKSGVSWEQLDDAAHEMSDNECARMMREKKYQLFKSFQQ
jgi:transposase InsO family protein